MDDSLDVNKESKLLGKSRLFSLDMFVYYENLYTMNYKYFYVIPDMILE